MRQEEEIRKEIKDVTDKIRTSEASYIDYDTMYLAGFKMALKWVLEEENQ
jgi:hypothetical protein